MKKRGRRGSEKWKVRGGCTIFLGDDQQSVGKENIGQFVVTEHFS